jgi:septal ring-binding cell division protein DamX
VKIKKIQGIIISSLFIVGLAGCSNSSSWNKGDSSPWKSKRDAEMSNAPSEEFVEVSLDEAVEVNSMEDAPVVEESMAETTMLESEMVAEPELESISDFDAEPVPVEEMSAFEKLELEAMSPEAEPEMAAIETVEEVSSVSAVATDIMGASSTAYAVQVYAGRVLANVTRYQNSHGLDNMQTVKTDHDGDIIHVLVGVYDDYQAAVQASIDIEQSTGSKPWVRSVAGLQNMSVE